MTAGESFAISTDPITGEVRQTLFSPRDPRGKPPEGFRFRNEFSDELEPIPGGPKDIKTAETAGRISLTKGGLENVRKLKGELFKDGKLDRGLLLQINTNSFDGRRLRSFFDNASAAQLRLETGAAATETELDNNLSRFLPNVALDGDKSALAKIEALENFLSLGLEDLGS